MVIISREIDRLLARSPMTLIYGEAGAGKTVLLLHVALSHSRRGARVMFISTEGTLYSARVAAIDSGFENTFFTEVNTLDELLRLALLLYMSRGINVVLIDSVNAPYRLVSYAEGSIEKLGLLHGILRRMAVERGVRVYCSAQVRAIEEADDAVRPSGMPILEFWYDTILRVERMNGERVLRVEKPDEASGISRKFIITETGVEWIE